MTRPNHPLELLAPAKNADFGIAAINHGADAVYIGGPAFGARANAGNTLADIERLSRHAHRFNAKVFVALNTILRDDELDEARQMAWQAYESGADALIVQDMGLLEMDLPPIQLHASTQTDNRNPAKVKFLEDAGFSQVVLARELSMKEVAQLPHKPTSRSNISSTARSASPSAASASSATPIPGAAPTAANARRPAGCPIRWWTTRARPSPKTSICCR
jgi:collagenase-like PrtC family protease